MASAQSKINMSVISIRHSALFICAMLLVIFSSQVLSQSKIINGDNVSEADAQNKYPWMVSLRDSVTGEHYCGGTLIGAKWVLSSTSCFYGISGRPIVAIIGDRDLSKRETGERRVDVINRVESGRDLMLLELAVSLEDDASILRIASPEIMDGIEVGGDLIVLGWGAVTVAAQNEYPDLLQEAQIPLISQRDCQNDWNEILANKFRDTTIEELGKDALTGSEIDDGHICIKEISDDNNTSAGSSVCDKDTGGPLLFDSNGELIQVGVLSFQSNTCDIDSAQVFTRVSSLFDFIRETINERDLVIEQGLNENVVVSVLESVDEETGALNFEFESVDQHVVKLKNNGTVGVQISSIASELVNSVPIDNPETEVDEGQKEELVLARFHDYVRPIVVDGVLQCNDGELLAGESCNIVLESRFVNAGVKQVNLFLTVEGLEEPISFALDLNVLGLSSFSRSFGENVYFYQERNNEWAFLTGGYFQTIDPEPDATLDTDNEVLEEDYIPDLVNGVGLLGSSLENYDQTRLLVKVVGSGVLNFDWLTSSIDAIHLSFGRVGDEAERALYGSAFERKEIVLSEDIEHTFEFKLEIDQSVVDSLSFETEDLRQLYIDRIRRDLIAIKSVSFEPDNVQDDSTDSVSSNSDSGGGSIGSFTALILIVLWFCRWLALEGVMQRRLMQNKIFKGESK